MYYLNLVSLYTAEYKMLSYRRETALQSALVLAKSGRLELGDNIYRHFRSIFNHCRRDRPPPTNHSYSQNTRLNDLSYGIKIRIYFSSLLSQFTRLTDRQTDGRRPFSRLDRPAFNAARSKIEPTARKETLCEDVSQMPILRR